MELIPPPRNQHEDRESLGSDYFACSQSRKMSIGILAQPPTHQSNPAPPLPTNTAQDPPRNTSCRSFSHQKPNLRAVDADGARTKSNPVNSKVVHLYAKQSVILQSSNGLHTKFDGVAYGTTRQEGDTERVQEFAFAAAHQVFESNKGQGEDNNNNCADKAMNGNTGSLKQKLWEALATVPSQVENDNSDSKAVEVDARNSDHKRDTAVKPKQSDDTIETDSQSPNVTTRRPVTRSLTRKRTPAASRTKLKQMTSKGGSFPSTLTYRWGNQEKNIFNFNEEEERPDNLNRATNISLTTKTEKMNNRIEPRRISFCGKKRPKKTMLGSDTGEGKVKDCKTASCSTSVVEKSRSNPSHNSADNLPSESRTTKEEFRRTSDSKKEIQNRDFSCPELTKKSSLQKDLPSDSSEKNSIPECDTDSPILKMKTKASSYTFKPQSHKSLHAEQDIQSPAPDQTNFLSKGFYNLRTRQRSKKGFTGFNAEADSSEDINDLQKSPIEDSAPVMEEIGAIHKSSQSSEDQEKESLEDEHIYKGCRPVEMETAGLSNAEESPLTIHTSKKLRRDGLSHLLPSRKGTVEIDELVQPSDQNQEDGLMRAVSLLAMALERFKTRIHTQTSKKSSEILASLGEGIQLQLQSVNTQIQNDVLKFTNHGKSKRKILETRFEEQQEQLKSIHYKYKEEVAQHLQECKSTLGDLEAFQIELKGDAKRQKALHQKLILEAEEAIKTELSEADRRITSVHEVAREKMFQLRHVITECLKDGVFS